MCVTKLLVTWQYIDIWDTFVWRSWPGLKEEKTSFETRPRSSKKRSLWGRDMIIYSLQLTLRVLRNGFGVFAFSRKPICVPHPPPCSALPPLLLPCWHSARLLRAAEAAAIEEVTAEAARPASGLPGVVWQLSSTARLGLREAGKRE